MQSSAALYRSRWILTIAIAATLLAATLPQALLYDDITDDAFISFRYADRLASGSGLTFNPNERVEGFSNPLWTLLIGVGVAVTAFDAPDLARGLGLLCALGTLALLWLVVWRTATGPLEAAVLGTTACGLVLAAPGFHVYATAGLEVPLLMFLLTAGVSLAVLRRPDRSAGPGALSFGLAGITRPEGPLYGLAWFGVDRLPRGGKLDLSRAALLDLALVLLPAAVYQVFRMAYYGALLPNTFLAKPPDLFGGPLSALRQIRPWLAALGGLPALAFLAVLVLNRLRLSPRSRAILRQTAGPISAGLIFALYARGDWMPFGRFLLPVWPLAALSVTMILVDGATWLAERNLGRWRLTGTLVLGGALMISGLFAWMPELRAYRNGRGMLTTVMRGHDQIAQGTWIARHVSPGSTVAVRHIGAIAYLGPDLVIWDVNGLTDREQAMYVASGYLGGFEANPILRRRPDVIAESALPASWSYVNRPDQLEWMQRHYTKVQSLPHGPQGTVDVWVAKERFEDVFVP